MKEWLEAMAEEYNMPSVFSIAKANSASLSRVPVENGQMVFVDDTKQIFFDYNGVRQYYCMPIEITEQKRLTTIDPAKAYYYAVDTNIMWMFGDNGWRQLTPSNLTPIVFDVLPQEGEEDTLYVEDNGIKRWKNGQYNLVANVLQWDKIA